MAVMAVSAGGGIFLTVSQGKAVDTSFIALGLLLMATGAIHWVRRDIIVRMFGTDIRMAARASIGLVNRCTESSWIDEQRNRSASGVGRGESFVGVAIETCRVLYFCGKRETEPHKESEQHRYWPDKRDSPDAHTS